MILAVRGFQAEETTLNFSSEAVAPKSSSAPLMTSLARGTQLPHCVPHPVAKLSSLKLEAPSLTALWMAESLTA